MTTIEGPRPITTGAAGSGGGRTARRRNRIGWAFVAFSSLAIAGYFVGQYAPASLSVLAGRHVGLAATYSTLPPALQAVFYVHIVTSGLALALGPAQFITALRRRAPRVHRWIGRIYLSLVATGGAAAFVMSFVNSVGFLGFFGFGSLALLWMGTGWQGYRSIRRRDVAQHQAWMIRNFALTYAAVMLRTWLGVLVLVQLPFLTQSSDFETVFNAAYAPVPFLCWLPNLLVAEWLIRRRGLPSFRLAAAHPASPR